MLPLSSTLIFVPALEPRLVAIVGLLTAEVDVVVVCVNEVEFADGETDGDAIPMVLLASVFEVATVEAVEAVKGCTDSSELEEDEDR